MPTEPIHHHLLPIFIFPLLLLFGLGTSFEMILNWEEQRAREEAIGKEKINAELSFLKIQVNPHFFFNALNTIFSLSEKRSAHTGQAVLLLSNIMRYLLYEAKQGKVPLIKEVRHIEDYIAMQRLRISAKENILIRFTHKGDLSFVHIEPLLLVMFVENAFKHGVSYYQPSVIIIDLTIAEKLFFFTVVNSKKKSHESQHQVDMDHSGIGLVNARRRLDLIYGKRYQLDIEDTPDSFRIRLKIELNQLDDWKRFVTPHSKVVTGEPV